MTLSRAAEFPALHEDVHSWSQGSGVCSHPPEFAMAPFLRDVVQGPAVQEARAVQLCLVSYNVLSLLGDVPSVQPASDGLHGATGRVVLLSRVFEAKEVLVAGLQECRTPRGSMTCGPYRRLASGCDSAACFGVELWIHRHSPIEAMSAVILHAEPTLLIASATFAGESIRLLVGHAPHRVHTEAVRRDWWERALRLCRTFSGAAPWILLMDANARLGSETSSAVGSWEVDVQDLSGEMLHQLLSYLASWIPATFSSCALGDGHTLYQKRNATFARSDYVGVPLAWSVGTLQAWVDPEISAGHMCIDLFAAVVSAKLALRTSSRKAKPTRISANALADPENAPCIEAIIRQAPHPSWGVDASEHAALVVDHLYTALAHQFPTSKRRLRGSYLSALSGSLHHTVSVLRHRVRAAKVALRATALRCVFLAWNHRELDFSELFSGAWLWRLQTHYGLWCMLLRRFGVKLRKQCRADRAAHFASLASDVATVNPQDLHVQVRRVLKPKRYRKPGADPLPLLTKADGSVCESFEESLSTWRSHFADLEDGEVVPVGDLVRGCRARHAAFVGTDLLDIGDTLNKPCEPRHQARRLALICCLPHCYVVSATA